MFGNLQKEISCWTTMMIQFTTIHFYLYFIMCTHGGSQWNPWHESWHGICPLCVCIPIHPYPTMPKPTIHICRHLKNDQSRNHERNFLHQNMEAPSCLWLENIVSWIMRFLLHNRPFNNLVICHNILMNLSKFA